MKFEDENIEPMGMCSTCEYTEHYGDYGEIPCCNSDDERVGKNDKYGDTVQCPGWKPAATLIYCEKHNYWHWSTFEYSCKYCLAEWVASSPPTD